MATVKPFRGLRPAPGKAAQVASLPYDVMDSEEARAIVKDNPNSFLRVTKSEVDLPPGIDVHSPAVYQQAAKNLADFTTNGLLVRDETPCFYVYRQKMGQHEQVGLVAAVSVDEYEQAIIKKHELTRPDKEQDRVEHILTTGAQTGPVFLTYKETEDLNRLMAKSMTQRPAVDFTAEDGILHTLYVVNDPQAIAAFEAAFQQVEVLYIADGHHRSAAAARVRDQLRRHNPSHSGQEAYNFFLAVVFPDHMMKIMDYNRVVQDLGGLTETEFLSKVNQAFVVSAWGSGAMKPAEPQTFGMYLAGRWFKLMPRPGICDGMNALDALDVNLLQNHLLSPVLGITDPRTDKRIAFVGGIRGMAELEKLVDSGRYAVAFSLFPTAISQLMEIADAGEIMPPKSTWFEPKLRDAMVVHVIK